MVLKHTQWFFEVGWLLTTTTLDHGEFHGTCKVLSFFGACWVSLLFLLSLISPSLDIQTAAEKVFGPLNIPRTPYLRKYLNVSGMIFCCKKKNTPHLVWVFSDCWPVSCFAGNDPSQIDDLEMTQNKGWITSNDLVGYVFKKNHPAMGFWSLLG